MTTQKKTLKLALEVLEEDWDGCVNSRKGKTITAIKKALAQPEQEPCLSPCGDIKCAAICKRHAAQPEHEPVAWDGDCVLGHCGSPAGCEASNCCRADYTTPPQRKPLTPAQRHEVAVKAEALMKANPNMSWRDALITQTEAKLRRKNTCT